MKKSLVVSVLLVMLCGSSNAHEWKNRWGLGVSSAAFKMWGGAIDRSSLSYAMSLEARYGVLPFLQVGADFGYGSFKPSHLGSSTVAEMGDPYRTFVFPLNLSFKLTPLKDNLVKPYLLLGGGLLFWELRDVSDKDENIFTGGGLKWGENIRNAYNFGLAYGVGFEWFLWEKLAVDLQARNSHFLGEMQDNVGYGDANDRYGEFKLGLLFYFGGKADSDNDGVPDELDVAPLQPEDKDGFQDADGAPDLDNDNDGVPDIDDLAPNDPEDIDGFRDDDGVPDIDNDRDGIIDEEDGAPMAPEDFDGFEDDDGVPDFDNDGDGIVDQNDACPNQAETVNGIDDEDGCPDQAVAPEIFQRKEVSLVQVRFNTGSAELAKDSLGDLDRLVLNLIEFPQVVIEIRGHTDNVGDDFANQILSEKRAAGVREYILSKGIEPERVTSVGFGERYPIAENDSSAGRAINRRIEMLRVR